MKKVITVLGPVDPDEIGITMMHEHIMVDLSDGFVEPQEASLRAQMYSPVSTEMLGLLRRRPFSVTLDNLILGDVEVAIDEVGRYRREGGQTIVDCSSIGIGRDPKALYRISRATNVHIVMGGGLYTENSHPAWVKEKDVSELADLFERDVTIGVDGTGIRSGIIGEIGTGGVQFRDNAKDSDKKVGDVTAQEEKVLRAAARAAIRTGVAVTVHVDLRGHFAFHVIDILQDEGLPVDRMVMGHIDLVPDLEYHREVLRRGVFVEYDQFGREYYTDEMGLSWGHDTWRVDALANLVAEGFADQLVLSHDIALKMDLRRYGGVGYGYLLAYILPMLRNAGVSEKDLHKMLVANPRRILSVEWDEQLFADNHVLQHSGKMDPAK